MVTTAYKSCVFIFAFGLYLALATSAAAQTNTVVSSFSMSGELVGSSTETASGSISITRAPGDEGDVNIQVGSNGPVTITPGYVR